MFTQSVYDIRLVLQIMMGVTYHPGQNYSLHFVAEFQGNTEENLGGQNRNIFVKTINANTYFNINSHKTPMGFSLLGEPLLVFPLLSEKTESTNCQGRSLLLGLASNLTTKQQYQSLNPGI